MNKPIYRMSSAGYCPRKLSAMRLGLEAEPLPKWLDTAATEGNWHEKRIKEELRNNNLTVYDEQLELKIEQPTFDLIGHIDGKIAFSEEGIPDQLLEVKSMSQFEFDRWMKGGFAAFHHYAGQLACYLHATGLEHCMYIVKNRNNGYTDVRTINKIENGFFDIENILIKIADIEEHASRVTLYPAEFDLENIECRRCEYKKLCLPKAKELNDIDKSVLAKAAETWRQGKRLTIKGNELIEEAKSLLEIYTIEQPEKKFVIDNLAVVVYDVKEAPISYIRKAYTACKITDLRKEDD